MGGQKSEPINQTTQTTKVNRQATNSNQPRQIGIWMYCFSPSPYLPIFMPIFVPIFVPISVPVQVYRSVMTITHLYKPYPPSPI